MGGDGGKSVPKSKRPPVWEVVSTHSGELGALLDEYYEQGSESWS